MIIHKASFKAGMSNLFFIIDQILNLAIVGGLQKHLHFEFDIDFLNFF